jgi:L-alanine-DL-glutamate epimerase-like enolase superfamily enzyme
MSGWRARASRSCAWWAPIRSLGKLLGQPITKLLGGPLRDSVAMYSHGDALKDMSCLASCREWIKMMREQPEGFTTFKIEPSQTLRGERVGPIVTSAQLRKIARGGGGTSPLGSLDDGLLGLG